MSSRLLVYLNEDVELERPYRLDVPPSVDTLAELCQHLTSLIPPRNDETGRGYRFLYSIKGKPLWRVRECVEAHMIVLSLGPGFLVRRPSAVAGPAMAVDLTPHVRHTPDDGDRGLSSASASPPVKVPTAEYSHFYSSGAERMSAIGAAQPLNSPAALPSPAYPDSDRVVSITMSTAMRGAPPMSPPLPYTMSYPPPPVGDAAATATAAEGGSSLSRGVGASQLQWATTAPFPPPSVTIDQGASAVLPRHRSLLSADRPSGDAAAQRARPHQDPGDLSAKETMASLSRCLDAAEKDQTLLCLLLRKWQAYQRLHEMQEADVVGAAALTRRLSSIVSRNDTSALHRIVVSGPPISGVSTVAAFLLRLLVQCHSFQPGKQLSTVLLLPIDFSLLLPETKAAVVSTSSTPRLLLDLDALFQMIVRVVMDAVAVQRPGFRDSALVLSTLWDKAIKWKGSDPAAATAPDFTSYPQAEAIVGASVLQQWNIVVGQIFPTLQAACRNPEVPELRDAALHIIFSVVPMSIATAFHFSGILYSLDGCGQLGCCYANKVTRPMGDWGPVVDSLLSTRQAHVILAWPSMLPVPASLPSRLTAHIETRGLLSDDDLRRAAFPSLVRCCGHDYSLHAFMGCPGYLALLLPVIQPYRQSLSIPTTAFSSVYQQHYEGGAAEPYVVRMDSEEVHRVMEELQKVGRRSELLL